MPYLFEIEISVFTNGVHVYIINMDKIVQIVENS